MSVFQCIVCKAAIDKTSIQSTEEKSEENKAEGTKLKLEDYGKKCIFCDEFFHTTLGEFIQFLLSEFSL